MELVQACILWHVGFSRPDLDGNKLAKGMCSARKVKIEKCLSNCTVSRQLIFELKSASKELTL